MPREAKVTYPVFIPFLIRVHPCFPEPCSRISLRSLLSISPLLTGTDIAPASQGLAPVPRHGLSGARRIAGADGVENGPMLRLRGLHAQRVYRENRPRARP